MVGGRLVGYAVGLGINNFLNAYILYALEPRPYHNSIYRLIAIVIAVVVVHRNTYGIHDMAEVRGGKEAAHREPVLGVGGLILVGEVGIGKGHPFPAAAIICPVLPLNKDEADGVGVLALIPVPFYIYEVVAPCIVRRGGRFPVVAYNRHPVNLGEHLYRIVGVLARGGFRPDVGLFGIIQRCFGAVRYVVGAEVAGVEVYRLAARDIVGVLVYEGNIKHEHKLGDDINLEHLVRRVPYHSYAVRSVNGVVVVKPVSYAGAVGVTAVQLLIAVNAVYEEAHELVTDVPSVTVHKIGHCEVYIVLVIVDLISRSVGKPKPFKYAVGV